MKKLLITLFSVFCITSVYAQKTLPYEIDEEATANAPINVGETFDMLDIRGLKFLGVTKDGYYLVQRFYSAEDGGMKLTDPFLILSDNIGLMYPSLYHGRVVTYRKNGEITSDCTYENGNTISPPCVSYNSSGDIAMESTLTYKDNIYTLSSKSKNFRLEKVYNYNTGDASDTQYSGSGQKVFEAFYKDGLPVGIGCMWDEDGNLIDETDFIHP